MSRFAVLFAMPTSEAEFFAAANKVPVSDYIRLTLGGGSARDAWERRYTAIADAAQALLESLRSWQVPLVESATLADLHHATKAADVVVVFAHWYAKRSSDALEDGCLELADGMHPPESIEAALTADFDGTLDLCNCMSSHLASLLKRRRGNSVWPIFNENLLDPLPAYVIVRQLMEHCLKTGMDYRLARLQTADELRRGR